MWYLEMLPGRAVMVSSLRAAILLSNGINGYPLVWDKKLYQNPPEEALPEQLLVGFHLYEQNSVDSLSF
jgi:hypothetical protein